MSDPHQPNKVVLVVEDDDLFASSIEIALGWLAQVSVVLANSAERALEVLSDDAGAVKAVLTDLNLPGMSGYTLIARIRKDPRYRGLPIVVISGDTDPRAAAKAREEGADAFFPKPISTAAMRLRLEELLNANRTTNAE